jgi:tetratricopeptide (TPR) repeat protein
MKYFILTIFLLITLLLTGCQESVQPRSTVDEKLLAKMQSEADSFLRMSSLHFETGYRKIGLENLKRAFMKNPYDVESFTRVTIMLEKEEDWETLVDFYNYAINKHGNFPILFSKLGEYYTKLEKYNEAVNAFKYAIALNSADPQNYYLLAYAYEQLDQPEDALSTLNILLIIMERNPFENEEAKKLQESAEKNRERLERSLQIPVGR